MLYSSNSYVVWFCKSMTKSNKVRLHLIALALSVFPTGAALAADVACSASRRFPQATRRPFGLTTLSSKSGQAEQ